MSTILDALDPWMEREACDAIVNASQSPETRFVQVLKRSPKLLVLSDKCAYMICTMMRSEQIIPAKFQVGSLLKLSHYEFIVADEDDEEMMCSIQLQTNSIELLGAQGMGIVGDPIDIHETIQVRRAMASIQMDAKILMERLAGTKSSTGSAARRKAGDALALLENSVKLEQLLGDDDDDSDNDEIEEEQPMTQHFESPVRSRGKAFQSMKNEELGDPLALLDDADKLEIVMGSEDDGEKSKCDNGEDESAVKMGDPMALLADSSKLQEIMAGDTDDDDDDIKDIHNRPETQDVRAQSPPPRTDGEYEIPLKESPSRSDKSNSATRCLQRNLSNVSPVPLHDEEDGKDAALQNQLAAVAEESRGHNKRSIDDDGASSTSSDPIGISDMLLPPTQPVAAPVAPVNRKRLLMVPSRGKRGKGVRINAASAETLSRQRPDFLSASSPREVSTSTQPTANLTIPSDEEYLRRFRKTRTFLDMIWEQRNNDVIKFR